MARRPPRSSWRRGWIFVLASGLGACLAGQTIDLGTNADTSAPGTDAGSRQDAPLPADADATPPSEDAPATDGDSEPALRRDANACAPGQDFVVPAPTGDPTSGGPTLPGWLECTPAAGSSACSLPPFDGPRPLRLQMSFLGAPTEQAMASADLCSPVAPGASYAIALEMALEGPPFDGGKADATVSVEIWAGANPCEADELLATTPVIADTCGWTSACVPFVSPDATRNFPYLVVNAYSASLGVIETDYVLVGQLRFVISCAATAGTVE